MSINLSPRLSLILGALCISFSPIFTRLTGVPGLSSAFYRVAMAFVIYLPFALYHGYYRIDLKKVGLPLLCGLFFAMDLACWNQSLMITNTAVSTVLSNLSPVWAGMLLFLFTSYKPSWYYWIGVMVALIGLVILIGWSTVLHLEFDYGSVLALVASFFYACYMILAGKARVGLSTMTFMFYSMLGYMIFAWCFVWWFESPLSGYATNGWVYLLLLAIVPQLMGWLFVNHALGSLPSTEVSMVLLGQIVIASLLATILFKESLLFHQIAGGLIIMLGITITYIKK